MFKMLSAASPVGWRTFAGFSSCSPVGWRAFAQLLANEDISSPILLHLTHADMLRLGETCKAAQAAQAAVMGWMVRRLLTERPVRNVLPEGVRPDRVLIDI